MRRKVILSLGGSLIVPDGGIDIDFLKRFSQFIRRKISQNHWQFFIVTGGGALSRHYQEAGKKVIGRLTKKDIDWIGIYSTHLNSHLMRIIFNDLAYPRIIDDYQKLEKGIKEPVVLAAGGKPGSSTDYDAVFLAQFYGVKTVINLSDVPMVYEKDPARFPQAKPIKEISWPAFRQMIDKKWSPGMSVPFDPIASRLAQEGGLEVIILNGRNLRNLNRCLQEKEFVGTVIQ